MLVRDRTDDVLAASDVVITASGTATIQCPLHERPMVVVYKLSPLDLSTGQAVRAGRYVCDAQPRGRQRIVPELIQDEFTPERTAAEAVTLLTDAEQAGARCVRRWRECDNSSARRGQLRAPPKRCSK